jgi:hypothetical protein
MLPGFEDFMRPKSMIALQNAAAAGPTIILTTTDSTCCALIITLANEVACLKLPELVLSRVNRLTNLTRSLSEPGFDLDEWLVACECEDVYSHRDDGVGLEGAREESFETTPESVEDTFRWLLGYLWKTIVKPVFDSLNLQVSKRYCLGDVEPVFISLCHGLSSSRQRSS